MTYRLAKPEDFKRIDDYCTDNHIATPPFGLCFIAEDEGKIVGVINGAIKVIIEPFIARNPMVANVLWEKLMAVLSARDFQDVWIIPNQDHLIKEAEEKGFKIINKNITLLQGQVQ